jgi:hypothetical protein
LGVIVNDFMSTYLHSAAHKASKLIRREKAKVPSQLEGRGHGQFWKVRLDNGYQVERKIDRMIVPETSTPQKRLENAKVFSTSRKIAPLEQDAVKAGLTVSPRKKDLHYPGSERKPLDLDDRISVDWLPAQPDYVNPEERELAAIAVLLEEGRTVDEIVAELEIPKRTIERQKSKLLRHQRDSGNSGGSIEEYSTTVYREADMAAASRVLSGEQEQEYVHHIAEAMTKYQAMPADRLQVEIAVLTRTLSPDDIRSFHHSACFHNPKTIFEWCMAAFKANLPRARRGFLASLVLATTFAKSEEQVMGAIAPTLKPARKPRAKRAGR